MKLLLILFLSGAVQAASFHERLFKKGYHFSALSTILKQHSKTDASKDDDKYLEMIVRQTGPDVLEDYRHETLSHFKSPVAKFAMARKYFTAGKFDEALVTAKLISDDHWLYPEAQMLIAQVYHDKKDIRRELSHYKECSQSAAKRISGDDEYHFQVVMEVCAANHARELFKQGHLKAAMEEMNRFPKNSYLWPYLLYERAWFYFHQKNFNRSLGLLVTYKSPLLDTYYFPEAEYLTALNYFELCLYQDSSLIINEYYKNYRPRYLALEKILRENKNKKNYFFLLLFRKEKELKGYEDFVRQIVTRMKKQSRFQMGFKQIKMLNKEINRIKKKENAQVQKIFLPHLRAIRSNLVSKMDYFAKKDIFLFLEKVKFFSNELFKMNLEIISRKKDMIYDNKKLISSRGRGDYSNVNRDTDEYFWTFEGAFWADELGDYSFGLKSNCQLIERGKKK
jgi:hypothetical protein